MNLYFDTEFTGLVPGTTLISLGIVSENGYKFYAEFTDYDESLCDDWIKENVLSYLWLLPNDKTSAFQYDSENAVWFYKGNTNYISIQLLRWIEMISNSSYEVFENQIVVNGGERIQFVSDVCHYDFYLLQNQVFGGAFKMPDNINPVCYDICQDINEWSCMGVGNNFNTSENMHNAFDISREKLVEDALLELPKGRKHNALYDAEVIKILYEYYYNKKFLRRKMETIINFSIHKGWCRDTFDSWFEDPEYIKVCGMRLPMARKE